MEKTSQPDEIRDRVVECFAGRKIMITGATGFLGKVLLEKILRCMTGVTHVYILVRSKKGKEPKQRLDELFNSAVSPVVMFFFFFSRKSNTEKKD